MQDQLLRAISADGSASVRTLAATGLVREAVQRHRTSPAASVALARALMGGILLASEGQDGERVQIQLRGDGPFGTILVTAESDGGVRGYVQHPDANPPLRGPQLGVSAGVGLGALSIERNHPTWKQPYSGIVPIVTGEIAQDLAHYLLESEQKPSTVALGVYLSAGGEIEAAGGYLVQGLPGASDAVLAGAAARRRDRRHHPRTAARRGRGRRPRIQGAALSLPVRLGARAARRDPAGPRRAARGGGRRRAAGGALRLLR
jgi:molecular chaperone Hsp33